MKLMLILNLIILSVFVLTGHTFAQNHLIDGEYIKEWLVLGPFFPDDLKTDFLADVGGEATIHPQEGSNVTTADGKVLTWMRYTAKGNIVDLLDAVGDYENVSAYAFCILQSETAGDAQVYLGSHYAAKVWINGKQAHSNLGETHLNVDGYLFEVRLEAKANRCLIKVSRRTGDWGFTIRMKPLPHERAVLSGIIINSEEISLTIFRQKMEKSSLP